MIRFNWPKIGNGEFTKIKFDNFGRPIKGTNPSTLSGLGVSLNNSDIPKTLDNTWITNFNSAVENIPLNLLTAPTGNISLNSHNITNLADPINPQDAANKAYVDAAIQGLDVKLSVVAATIEPLPANTYSNGVITGETSLPTIDGINLTVGQRLLVKNEINQQDNGIYSVTNLDPFVLTRTSDANGINITDGLFTFIEQGNTLASTGWVLTSNDQITVGTTPLTFVQFSSAGIIQPGIALSQSGNIFNVNVDNSSITVVNNKLQVSNSYSGSTSITTVGNINTGTWNGSTIGINYGGTGLTNIGSPNYVLGANSAGTSLEYKEIHAGSGINITNNSGQIVITNTQTQGLTSVGLNLPDFFNVSNSPLTANGTISVSLNTETNNSFFAAPDGSTGTPTFRNITNNDLPNSGISQGTYSKITVNSKGIATLGANLSSTDISNILGFNPADNSMVVHLSGTEIITGTKTFSTPFNISSNSLITNLNADLLDGQHGSYFLDLGNSTGNLNISLGGTGLSNIGAPDTILGVDDSGTVLEYKTITAGSGVSITNNSGIITVSATGTGGTVTSVGLSLPNIFTVNGSPVIGTGTLSATFNSQNSSTFFAAPSGSNGVPTFRTFTNNDLPNSGIIQGTFTKITFNNKGIATFGNNLAAGDISTALGYTPADDSTVVHKSGNENITGTKTFSAPIISNVGTGTAPLSITSTTVISNLNADLLDGQHGAFYSNLANATGNLATNLGGTGLSSIGSANTILGVDNSGTVLEYKTLAPSDGISITNSNGNITIANTGDLALSVPAIFNISGSPASGHGNINITLNPVIKNQVLASPDGTSGTPTFRKLVGDDIPILDCGFF